MYAFRLIPRLQTGSGHEPSRIQEFTYMHYVCLVPMLFACMYQEAGEEPGKRARFLYPDNVLVLILLYP